ncbi:hypothetical protein BH20VER1_BH20VER1_19010 [soil metagenome]
MGGMMAPKRERIKQGGDLSSAAMAELERYCEAHPRSPSAVRHPRVMRRGSTFIALLGGSLDDGIAGIGGSVEAALRAFDVQYARAAPRPS